MQARIRLSVGLSQPALDTEPEVHQENRHLPHGGGNFKKTQLPIHEEVARVKKKPQTKENTQKNKTTNKQTKKPTRQQLHSLKTSDASHQ